MAEDLRPFEWMTLGDWDIFEQFPDSQKKELRELWKKDQGLAGERMIEALKAKRAEIKSQEKPAEPSPFLKGLH